MSINFSAQTGCRISVEQHFGVEWVSAFQGILGYFSILLSEFLTSTDLLISLENNTEFISCHREESTLLGVVNPCPVTSDAELKCRFRSNLLEEPAGLGRGSCLFIVAPHENFNPQPLGFGKDYYFPWTKPGCGTWSHVCVLTSKGYMYYGGRTLTCFFCPVGFTKKSLEKNT